MKVTGHGKAEGVRRRLPLGRLKLDPRFFHVGSVLDKVTA